MKRIVGLAVFLVCLYGLLWWRFLVLPINGDKPIHFVLKPGTTAIRFSYALSDVSRLSHPHWFVLLMRFRGDLHHLRGGEYIFPPYSTPNDVLNQVVQGSDIYHAFTIVNGWTIYQVLEALHDDPAVKHTVEGESLSQIAKQVGINASTPEGYLFPDTYFFRWGVSDVTLMRRAYTAMQTYLTPEWQRRDKNLPYRIPYQAMIVASMIEKETAKPAEKPMIAAVILKRMAQWMHLQIDASVIYGLGPNFKGTLSREDLRLKTPYNTYTRYGLPPTPICMPGPSSIQAALHPAQTDALYYVSKGDGTHVFSPDLAGQQAAIQKYILKDK